MRYVEPYAVNTSSPACMLRVAVIHAVFVVRLSVKWALLPRHCFLATLCGRAVLLYRPAPLEVAAASINWVRVS